MKKIRVAINGFGRIGRVYLRNCINNSLIDIVIINDLTNAKTLAHLLKYDSIHRKFDGEVKAEGNNLIINGKTIKVVSIKDPESLPWKENDIDTLYDYLSNFPKEKLEEMNDRHLRLVAEFDNYKKRNAKERLEWMKNAGQDIIQSILPTLDDFNRAIKQMEASKDSSYALMS